MLDKRKLKKERVLLTALIPVAMQSSILPEANGVSSHLNGELSSSSSSSHSSAQFSRTLECREKVALVTGAAKGIGRGIALRLARDGYKIGACDLPASLELLQSLGDEIKDQCSLGETVLKSRFLVLSADVSDENEVKKMVEDCVKTLGSLDIVSPNQVYTLFVFDRTY